MPLMLIILLVIVALFVVVGLISMFAVMGTKRSTGTMKGGHRTHGSAGSKRKKKRR